ncbi:bromodomain-containing protein 4-like isoform X2 [Oncorhynchus keta]|uniref:bromodomain-containing protein 4-like isoform X2 n=1 Tax=Oncorhynchus keta TaxID=8018 RepID=UPI00227C0748|nr:bromodomain-containing protein 4-like isoform X2 [Oncorhynchus keta]
MLNPRGMEPDPSLETCTQSRAETEGERTETREGPTRSPSPLSPNRFSSAHNLTTPPKLNPPRPSKLTLTPSASTLTLTPSASTLTLTPSASTLTLTPSASTLTLTSTCTPSSSSTPTPNPLKLNPTPSPPPTLTHKTLTTLTPMVLNPTPTCTPTSPSLTPNPVTPTILISNPTPPTLTPSLPTPTHAPTKVTHKPVPFPLTPPTIHFTSPLLTPSRSSPTVSAITSLPPSSVNHSNMSSAPGTSSLTNGNARPVPTPTSPPITPFHTPASRQIHFPRPLDTPTLVQAYQSTSSVRQRVSQQALLLGRSSCSSRDQMLLRTQMLQSLTLHPSAPGTLTIPPSLRLKPPSSSSHSPISRPRTPLFPPLRPRPQPSAMVTDRQTTPTRHLSVPPPTLYSSVRSVPLRPRLHSPNGHRVASPRHSPALQPIAAAAARQALPSRQWTGPASSLSSQTPPTQTTPGQSQLSSGSSPLGSTSCFDRLPPASRQLQIIALSAGSTHRLSSQLQPAANTHTPTSIQSKHLVLESPPPQLDAQPQRTSEHASPSPTSSIHKANTPLPYLHYQARHTDPKGEVGRQGVREERERVGLDEEMMGGIEEEQRNRERVGGDRQVTGEEKGNVDKRGERVGGQEKEGTGGEETWMERVKGFETLRELTEVEEGQERMKIEGEEQRERMEVEEGQERMKIEGEEQRERMEVEEEKQRERMEVEEQEQGQKDAMKGEEGTTIDPQLNPDPATQNPPSEPPINIQRPSDRPIEQSPDLPHVDQEDLCENMFNQSDNQSGSPSHPESLSLSQSRPETFSLLERKPWSQRVWPEGGRRVLTHLVEGFIIQEGLQAFPVNRSSLLLGGQEAISQNGNIEGAELLPLTDTPEPPEHSSESEQERVATSDPLTGPRERHRGVLHCESCGKRGHAHSFHRSKRYCSTSCARRYNVGLSKRLRALSAGSQPEGRRSEMNKVESVPGKPLLLRLPREIWSAHRRDNEEEEGHAVPTAARLERRVARRARRASEPAMTPGNSTVTSSDSLPAQWSVEQVWDFIHTLPGCVEVAEAFRVQEIDGQALLLLTEDHLMTSMNIKLGPALKICAHINTLRHR